MPDQASTPTPEPLTDAAPDAPSPAGADSPDALALALEATRKAGAAGAADTPDIAADDAGGTSLAEEIGTGSQKL